MTPRHSFKRSWTPSLFPEEPCGGTINAALLAVDGKALALPKGSRGTGRTASGDENALPLSVSPEPLSSDSVDLVGEVAAK